MTDPDLRAITRQRRQQGRCVRCGVLTRRAALCKPCRVRHRYCPRCESVWELGAATAGRPGRSSDYCTPCATLVRHGYKRPWSRYRAEQQQRMHPLLPDIIRLYRAGLSHTRMAETLDIPRGTLSSVINHARKTGRWPSRLKRGQLKRMDVSEEEDENGD